MNIRRLVCVLSILAFTGAAYAELQNVQTGGLVRVRGRYWHNVYSNITRQPGEVRIPAALVPFRAVGPFGVTSRVAWDSSKNDRKLVEQNTKLRVNADFTNNVSALIELDDYEVWGGGDFRSNHVTGFDARANSVDDVEVLQAYIETKNTFDLPIRLRIGRQQLKLGDGWLVGETQGLTDISFDALRLTYEANDFSVDAWASKLFENGVAEEDGDVDFYGICATYKGIEKNELSAYWLYVRDARSINDTNFPWAVEWIENWLGVDNYDVTNLHTFGVRAAGVCGPLDYKLELAYQTGNADAAGRMFRPFVYGDDQANFGGWAGEMEIGYTFDCMWKPRVFVGGAYFSGEDKRDVSFAQWLNPFDQPQASVSFNRMFSSRTYHYVFDQDRNTSNFNEIRIGASAAPTDAIKTSVLLTKLQTNAAFDWPWMVKIGPFRVPVAPNLPFLTRQSGKNIGWEAELALQYDYSKDLSIKFLWEHLFTDSAMGKGNFMNANGLEFAGGSAHKDADYWSFETQLKF